MENYQNQNTGMGSQVSYGFGGVGQTVTGIETSNLNTAKSPSIVEQLHHQEKAVSGLHLLVDQLVDRLALILGPVPTATSANASAPQPIATQISQRIPMHTRSIEAVGQRIAEIINRVEL